MSQCPWWSALSAEPSKLSWRNSQLSPPILCLLGNRQCPITVIATAKGANAAPAVKADADANANAVVDAKADTDANTNIYAHADATPTRMLTPMSTPTLTPMPMPDFSSCVVIIVDVVVSPAIPLLPPQSTVSNTPPCTAIGPVVCRHCATIRCWWRCSADCCHCYCRNPKHHPPCPLKADCCIVVIITSSVDVIVVVTSPPSQTYRPEQRREETRKTPWQRSCGRCCSIAMRGKQARQFVIVFVIAHHVFNIVVSHPC